MVRDPISTAFIYGLGAAVTVAWFASVIADILVSGYSTPIALHGLMGTVVGSVFADAGLRRARRQLLEYHSPGDGGPVSGTITPRE